MQCRLQMGSTERHHAYAGPLDCLRQTVRTEGLRGLARGLGGTMARECPGNAICECVRRPHFKRACSVFGCAGWHACFWLVSTRVLLQPHASLFVLRLPSPSQLLATHRCLPARRL